VLPLVPYYKNRGKKVSFSKKKRFQLAAGADLAREKAPFVEGKSFVVTANLANGAGNGIIVAQGGVTDGWSLYVKDGRLAFATRHQGKLSVVSGRIDSEKSSHQISATLGKNGEVTMSVDGKTVASGSTPGPMVTMPLDGLQVGSDLNGAVGKYEAPFSFDGTIEEVILKIGN
jgi:hypothetical protein